MVTQKIGFGTWESLISYLKNEKQQDKVVNGGVLTIHSHPPKNEFEEGYYEIVEAT